MGRAVVNAHKDKGTYLRTQRVPIWSILICTMPKRAHFLEQLLSTLTPQIEESDGLVDIIIESDDGVMTIGEKRNLLVSKCQSEYSSFIDDDDLVSYNYVNAHLMKLVSNPDGIGFKGRITQDGKRGQEFIHKGDIKAWQTLNGTFYRPLNHLNVVKNEYRIQAPFPKINMGEDKAQSDDMTKFIKNYEYIDEVMYFYRYVSKK